LTLADVHQLRDGRRAVVESTSEKISELGVQHSSAVPHPAGTVAMSRTASVGFSCIMGSTMATSQDFVTWTCGSKLDNRFLLWAIRGERAQILSRMQGSTHKTIYMPDLEDLRVSLPPLAEQRAIADYLDVETARIDALIAKKQQLIHLLEERIDAEIGTWIERSDLVDPAGHASVELRRTLRKLDRPPDSHEMITAFRDGQVTTRSARGREGFTNSWTENSKVQGVAIGDVVVHGLDGFSGAIGDSESDGVCSPVYHVCEAKSGDPAFVSRLLRRLALTGYLGNFAVSTRERAVDFRNWDLFGRIPIPEVPNDVQNRVGGRIRAIRPLREAVDRSSELANERKSALITRVVTGEFAVPGAP
jgi:type I restriction enzyme S subunit